MGCISINCFFFEKKNEIFSNFFLRKTKLILPTRVLSLGRRCKSWAHGYYMWLWINGPGRSVIIVDVRPVMNSSTSSARPSQTVVIDEVRASITGSARPKGVVVGEVRPAITGSARPKKEKLKPQIDCKTRARGCLNKMWIRCGPRGCETTGDFDSIVVRFRPVRQACRAYVTPHSTSYTYTPCHACHSLDLLFISPTSHPLAQLNDPHWHRLILIYLKRSKVKGSCPQPHLY